MRHVESGLGQLQVTCKRVKVLETLKKNLTTHSKVVEEAKVGWKTKAEAMLKSKMDDLASGKLRSLSVMLSPPQDHTDAYKLAIEMMEWHEEDTIVLDGQQVQNLIKDEWDWSRDFWIGNEGYSETASAGSAKYKG